MLPEDVIMATSINSFKNNLDKISSINMGESWAFSSFSVCWWRNPNLYQLGLIGILVVYTVWPCHSASFQKAKLKNYPKIVRSSAKSRLYLHPHLMRATCMQNCSCYIIVCYFQWSGQWWICCDCRIFTCVSWFSSMACNCKSWYWAIISISCRVLTLIVQTII